MRNCCLVLILMLAGCAMVQPSDGWRRAETKGFTFKLPPSLQLVSGNSADSHIVQYTNEQMTATFDEGASAGEPLDSLGKYPEYSSDTAIIHGKGVQIVSFDIPPGPGHRFDYAIAASYRSIGLTVYIHCRTKADYAVATKIFKTVRFKLF